MKNDDKNESIIRIAKNEFDERNFFNKYSKWNFHHMKKKFKLSNLFQLRDVFFEQFMTKTIHELCRMKYVKIEYV